MITTLHGDCLELLPTLDAGSAQTIVTSPPYWRMRQYTDDPREIGQEPTPTEYVAALVAVFRECRRVLADDGTLWLNLGDAYANDKKWGGSTGGKHAGGLHGQQGPGRKKVSAGLPPKSLIGLPWRVAFALQDDGWVLRNDIIWHKPNAMPASVTDRCVVDHEYLFLFSKEPHYYFNAEAISELAKMRPQRRLTPQKSKGGGHAVDAWKNPRLLRNEPAVDGDGTRSPRTVWSIPTEGLRDEHYAPMPQALAERCIKAGSRAGDTVLDPFGGSGTTGRAAVALGRRAVLIDLGYQELQQRRTDGVQMTLDAIAAD